MRKETPLDTSGINRLMYVVGPVAQSVEYCTACGTMGAHIPVMTVTKVWGARRDGRSMIRLLTGMVAVGVRP